MGAVIKVLLVEDTKIAQMVAVKLLQSFSFQVDLAESGTQALELVGKNHYDLIFMDIGLPEGNNFGLVATQTIRTSENSSSKAIIIALTAHDDEKLANQCIEYGMNYFLTKPLSADKVKDIINRFNLASST